MYKLDCYSMFPPHLHVRSSSQVEDYPAELPISGIFLGRSSCDFSLGYYA